ncbi:type VI secretion system tube protein Hcp [Limnoglobus roseus]|uniref:Type VI secretion system tube protein Hcp n=1 Tax=Limnoglobus roseus TaxID=2598579 RepID=A0A5C1AN91_9BACT|nr:type VI secretion system tube protein Hcp [Limnoglobus roseus]QEL19456.1 type VI secretion system tube protein Hcp [Limnoglobus roseus]
MAVDAYIWYKAAQNAAAMSPKGETTDEFFRDFNAFELKDFSFSVENKSTVGSATGGAGGGKIEFKEFEIKKPTDSASPMFFRNCAAGMHYEVVSIAIRKAGGEAGKGTASSGSPYLVFHFGTVFTTKIGWSGPGDEGPSESITFSYGELKIMYYPQTTDGKMSTQAKIAEWSQLKNINKFAGKPLAFET